MKLSARFPLTLGFFTAWALLTVLPATCLHADALPPGTFLDVNGNPLGTQPGSLAINVRDTEREEVSRLIALNVPSGMVGINATVVPGIVPIPEDGVKFDPSDSSTWSDAIIFSNFPAGGTVVGGRIQLVSDTTGTLEKGRKATDPKISGTEDDTANTVTYQVPGGTKFTVTESFTEPAEVPEPSTLLLIGSGLIGLVRYGRPRIRN